MENIENTDRDERNDERDIARLLQAAGPRESLPDELKDRWETRFRQELQAANDQRSSRKRRFLGSVAAGFMVCALAISLLWSEPEPTAALFRVSSVSGSVSIIAPNGIARVIEAGSSVQSGDTIRTGPDSRVAVAYAGYDLRVDVDSWIEFQDTAINLRSGQLYASDDKYRIGQTQLQIVTPHGEVRDIGTQFTVLVNSVETVATVRRGVIVVDTGNTAFQTEAREGSATQVTLDEQGQVHTKQVAVAGAHWQWIYDVAQEFQLEGKSAYEFLRWSVDESGRELRFDNTSTELYARRTVLHGSTVGLDPDRLVNPVLSATDLLAQLEGDTLVVSLR